MNQRLIQDIHNKDISIQQRWNFTSVQASGQGFLNYKRVWQLPRLAHPGPARLAIHCALFSSLSSLSLRVAISLRRAASLAAGENLAGQRRVTILGAPEAQWKAQYLIFQKLREEGFAPGNEDIRLTVEILVPSSQVTQHSRCSQVVN